MKNRTVLGTLVLQTTLKTDSLEGGGIQQLTEKRLTCISLTWIRTPYTNVPPSLPKTAALNQRKKRGTLRRYVFLLVKLQWNPKDKDVEFLDLTKRFDIIQLLEEDK